MTTPVSCDEVQLKLSCEDPLSTAERDHATQCADCAAHAQAFAQLLADARLPVAGNPAPGALAQAALRQWQRSSASPARRVPWLGYVAAALLGGVVARGLGPSAQAPVASQVAVVQQGSPAPALAQAEPLNVAADEVSFEVEWPTGQAEDELNELEEL